MGEEEMKHLFIDKKIKKCVECPYIWTANTCLFPQCEHPKRGKENNALVNEGGIPPKWCPLSEVKEK